MTNTNRNFGYARVSTKDQNEARQIESLTAAGVAERDLFIDKASGKDFAREQYQVLKRSLREGDTLFIHSLDRLGRDKDGILNEWAEITKQIGADIVVLDMPLLDTRKYKDSVGSFVTDLVLQYFHGSRKTNANALRSANVKALTRLNSKAST